MLLVPHEPDGTSDSPVPMARPSPAPGQHLKVLLVAEETLVRRALARVVDSCVGGAEVTEAGGTAEAVDILRRTPHDVALADVGRPPREGIQLLQEIRSTWPDLPVILLSAYDDGESVRAALAAGASGYVLKDAAPEDLAQAVRVAQSGSGNMLSSRAARNASARALSVEPSRADRNRGWILVAVLAIGVVSPSSRSRGSVGSSLLAACAHAATSMGGRGKRLWLTSSSAPRRGAAQERHGGETRTNRCATTALRQESPPSVHRGAEGGEGRLDRGREGGHE